MSALTAPCSRTKVRNDFGCFIQEINSSPVPETIERCHVLSSGGPAPWAGLLLGARRVETRDLEAQGIKVSLPTHPQCRGQGSANLPMGLLSQAWLFISTACGSVGPQTHGRQAPLSVPQHAAPSFAHALSGSSCSICPVKVPLGSAHSPLLFLCSHLQLVMLLVSIPEPHLTLSPRQPDERGAVIILRLCLEAWWTEEPYWRSCLRELKSEACPLRAHLPLIADPPGLSQV